MTALESIIESHPHLTLSDTQQLYQGEEALPVIQVSNVFCDASVSLYGAHVLSFKPKGKNEALWISPNTKFQAGTAIRGGVPVCFPWFAVNQDDPSKPKHGYVRQRLWSLESSEQTDKGETKLTLVYQSQPEDKAHFEGEFDVKLHLTFGESLTMTLDVTNTGTTPYPIRWALHTYFAVSSVNKVSVSGLDGVSYRDNTKGLAIATQAGNITFNGEVDMAFFEAPARQTINDNGTDIIAITGDNAPSAIVWNIGTEKGDGIADIGGEASTGYVCVERGCAFSDVWQLAPGEQVQGTKTIEVL